MQQKHKILIVDDDQVNVAILTEILDEIYDLEIARTGKEALGLTQSFRPEIILLDIMMPTLNGYEVCKEIRSNPEYEEIKVILVSGKAMVDERIQGYEAGADDFIVKPFVDEELLAKVKVYLSWQRVEK